MMTKKSFLGYISQKLICITICITCLITLNPISANEAYAEARKTDLIVSATMTERGLKATDCPDINANVALLAKENGEVLYSRNADVESKIASLTKIITAGCALKHMQLTDTVTVSTQAANVGGSTASLVAGDEMTFLDALYCMMLPSGNDAAQAVAEATGAKLSGEGSNLDKFVAEMNSYAQSLGCTNSKFTNPHGLDEDEYESDSHSTANDLLKIINDAMSNETLSEIVKTPSKSLTIKRSGENTDIALESTDQLLDSFDGANGIKTGTTDKAGYCFAGAFDRAGEKIYTVVLASESDGTRFSDTENLANWYFDNMVDYKLVNTTNNNNVMCEVPHSDFIDKTVSASITNADETIRIFKFNGNISQNFNIEAVSGDIKKGDKVGEVSFYQNNKILKTLDLVATENVSRAGIIDTLYTHWKKFTSIFSGEKTLAESHFYNQTPEVIEY